MKRRSLIVIFIYFYMMYINPMIYKELVLHIQVMSKIDLFTFSYLFLFIMCLVLFQKELIYDLSYVKKINYDLLLKQWLILFFMYLVSCIIITSSYSVSDNEIAVQNYTDSIISILIVVMIGPFIEELVFRVGVIRLFSKINIGIVVSSVLFGLVHCIDYVIINRDMERMVWSAPHIIMGLGLGYIYKKHQNIYAVVICHMIINIIATLG